MRIAYSFILGVVSIMPTIIIIIILNIIISGFSENISNSQLFYLLLVAPVIEEIMKGMFVILLDKYIHFEGPMEGLIFGGMVGAGFAAVENYSYGLIGVSTSGIFGGITLTFVRGILQIFGHPVFTGIFGAGVGCFNVNIVKSKYQYIGKSIQLHAFWNFVSLFPGILIIGGFAFVVFYAIRTFRVELHIAVDYNKHHSVKYTSEFQREASLYEKIIVVIFSVFMLAQIIYLFTQSIITIILIFGFIFWVYAVDRYEHHPKPDYLDNY
ncbi:MAG: PrsW family intramembrane metalloprotease [Candidatus Kariarchaeaceae archaeon]|jgi:RsiW-degrading membrane proteinase PrsW (M82 family)